MKVSMEFTNRANKFYNVSDNKLYKFLNKVLLIFFRKKKIVWESRSVAVTFILVVFKGNGDGPFILVSKRGPSAADFQGKMNLVAGYLDWDETSVEAVFRESWEECGINVMQLIHDSNVIVDNLSQPWYVNSRPRENRQNVTLRYGLVLKLKTNDLPEVTTENNEVEGETEEILWMPSIEVDKHSWAFGHDEVIKEYEKITAESVNKEFNTIPYTRKM